jgi:hypothetical protein
VSKDPIDMDRRVSYLTEHTTGKKKHMFSKNFTNCCGYNFETLCEQISLMRSGLVAFRTVLQCRVLKLTSWACILLLGSDPIIEYGLYTPRWVSREHNSLSLPCPLSVCLSIYMKEFSSSCNLYLFGEQLLPDVMFERLALLLRIREVAASNLGPETGYTHSGFRGFPQSLQANAGIVP